MKLDPLLPVFITKRLIESNLYRYFFRHPKWHFFFSAQALFLFRFGFFFFLNGSLCPATDRLEWGWGGVGGWRSFNSQLLRLLDDVRFLSN